MGTKSGQLIREIESGVYDSKFQELYVDTQLMAEERDRYIKAIRAFETLFGEKEIEIYSAPGRSEVGGNHTDHQRGKVLATSVNIDTIAVVAPADDNTVHLKSEGYPRTEVSFDDLSVCEAEFGSTKGLIRGVAAGIAKRGGKVGGFYAYATGQVLSGSGLSSSAAFEVLTGNILSGLYNEGRFDAVTLAQIGQEAENQFFGKPCGLMDQMACSVGGLIHIDFKDKEHPVVSKVDVDFGAYGLSLCIVDTKGSHADLTPDYAAVPAENRAVAAYFGKEVLSEVEERVFYANIEQIRKAAGDRAVVRAIHFFNDNKNVDTEKECLEKGDISGFLKAVEASGNSSYRFLQNVYSPRKINEQGVSVGIAVAEHILAGRGVCRVHGGGFAGTMQAFVPDAVVPEYKAGMEAVFGEGSCYVLKVRPIGGTKVM